MYFVKYTEDYFKCKNSASIFSSVKNILSKKRIE